MKRLMVGQDGSVKLTDETLRHIGVSAGEKVDIYELPNGRIEVRAAPTGDISRLFGFLHSADGPCLTIDEINEVIAKGWAGEFK